MFVIVDVYGLCVSGFDLLQCSVPRMLDSIQARVDLALLVVQGTPGAHQQYSCSVL